MKEFEDDEYLKQDQMILLKEIAEQFSIDDNAADLGILYECTGFRGSNENDEFWANYKDFEDGCWRPEGKYSLTGAIMRTDTATGNLLRNVMEF